jgi:crossover junction endodeoxyribonuclease RuvC
MQNKKRDTKYEVRSTNRTSLLVPHTSTIMGIDPGYGRIGIAIIEKTNISDGLIYSECFETDPKLPHSKRLLSLSLKIQDIIDKFKPQEMAVETLLFSKNQKTALQVSEARGVIITEGAKKNLLIREFNPNEIKLAVTGYGKSDKKQIIEMVHKILKLDHRKRLDDEYDAIATALTCSAIRLSLN